MAVVWCCFILAFVGFVCSASIQEPNHFRVPTGNTTTETCYEAECYALVSDHFHCTRNNTISSPVSSYRSHKENLSTMHELRSTARGMLSRMNTSADPCEDFNEFACGYFNRHSNIPDGSTEVTTMSLMADQNTAILKGIIEEATTPSQPAYLSNIKLFYNSCLDEAQIETVGLTPYLNDRAFVDDWPTLNPSWSGANFDLSEVIARYLSVYINPIVATMVYVDMNETNKNVVYLLDGALGLDQEKLVEPRNDSVIEAYEKYLVETAVALNAGREVAERDAREVVDIEIELTKIKVPPEGRRNFSKLFNPVKLNELPNLYPELDIAGALRAVFNTANITLADDETVINLYPTYYGNLSSVLTRFSNRALQNLFGFKYAVSRVKGLTQRMRAIQLDFDTVHTGAATEKPRWEVCVDETSSIFRTGMSKQFINRTFPATAKHKVNEMVDNIMAEFKIMIEDSRWLSQDTKTEAIDKLAAMKRKIAYPDADFEETDIETFYENYTMKADDYYNNRLMGSDLDIQQYLTTLKKPLNKNKWEAGSYEVEAFYSSFQNTMTFIAGILSVPFFSMSYPEYMNYGAIGSVIGHEITHGFDTMGSQTDANGTLRNWWTTEDKQRFENKTQCVRDQNFNVYVEEINMTLNGNKTLSETIADYGGLEQSYRAYIRHIRRFGREFSLPHLHLSQRKLFFLAYAQMYCAKLTPEQLRNLVSSDPHPPPKYRLIAALQNSKQFAKAYNCPRGSYMNPVEKCIVW